MLGEERKSFCVTLGRKERDDWPWATIAPAATNNSSFREHLVKSPTRCKAFQNMSTPPPPRAPHLPDVSATAYHAIKTHNMDIASLLKQR